MPPTPLAQRLRRLLFGPIAIYAAATALGALLTLLQTRVLWRGLSRADFGVWSLVDPLLPPLAGLALFGVDQAIVKQLQADRVPLREVTGTLLVSTLPASAACLLAVGLIARFVAGVPWDAALVLTIAGEALLAMTQASFRSSGAARPFAAVLVSRNLLYLLGLLVLRHVDAAAMTPTMAPATVPAMVPATVPATVPLGAVFDMRAGASILVAAVALLMIRPVLRGNRRAYRDALHYGFPLLLTTFIYATTDMTDRWFLAEFSGVVTVGIYALHLKMAAILAQAIAVPFGLWFPPQRFKRLEDPDQGHFFFCRTAVALSVISAYAAGVVWLARDLVLPLIAPGIVPSSLVLACCLAGVVCLALSHALNVGLLMPGHTRKNTYCTAAAVATTVVASAVLVPLFGLDGAAISRITGGLVLVGVTAVASYRVMPIAFPFAALGLFFAGAGLAAIGIDAVHVARHWLSLAPELLAWTAAIGVLGGPIWFRMKRPAHAVPGDAAPAMAVIDLSR